MKGSHLVIVSEKKKGKREAKNDIKYLYKVEENIPITGKKKGGHTYPFDIMKVGDSFLVPYPRDAKGKIIKAQKVQENILYTLKNKYGKQKIAKKKFTTRQLEEGVRCWRIK